MLRYTGHCYGEIIAEQRLTEAEKRAWPELAGLPFDQGREAALNIGRYSDHLADVWRHPAWPLLNGPRSGLVLYGFTANDVRDCTSLDNQGRILSKTMWLGIIMIVGETEAVREVGTRATMFLGRPVADDRFFQCRELSAVFPVPATPHPVRCFPPAPEYQPGMARLIPLLEGALALLPSGFMCWECEDRYKDRGTEAEEVQFVAGRARWFTPGVVAQFEAARDWLSKQKRLKTIRAFCKVPTHMIAQALGPELGLDELEQGVLTLAAIDLGIPTRRVVSGGTSLPYAEIGISASAIGALLKKHEERQIQPIRL